MTSEISVQIRRIPPVRALTVRRSLSSKEEAASALAEIAPLVADVAIGPPLALQLGFPRDDGIPFELAVPVGGLLEREGFTCKTLPGLSVLSFVHEGSLTEGAEGENFADSWKRFVQFVSERQILVGDDPSRYVFHDGLDSVGTADEHVTLEVLYPYHLPMWLEAFEAGLSQCARPDAVERILAGSRDLTEALDGGQAAEWVQAAIGRLDEEVPDERSRACILNACAHHYIVQSGEILRSAWDESNHDLRKLVKRITEEALLGGNYRIDESGREPQLIIERRPARQEAHDEATDPAEKRYHACFCPLVRDAILEGKQISRTFCHCSGGWYVQEWENVFGEKPEVRLVNTMVEGADACVFAVKIPPKFW